MRRKPPSQRLAEIEFEGDLAAFVTAQRAAGETWRAIARDVSERLDQDINHVSLFRWYAKKGGNGEGEAA